MILRKPYAFFIKMFKPIHLAIGLLIGYLMVSESDIFSFLDKNEYTNINLVGQNIKSEYVSNSLYIVPIILMVLFIIILTIMFYKKKPITFYMVSIFCTIAILIINIYTINFFDVIEESIVSIKSVKLIHDLVFISMFIEGVLLIFVLIRGVGIDIRKFNFDSDISKIDIKDSDNEEFEVNIRFNIDQTRRERNKRIRYLKYAYAENKFIVNIVLLSVIILITVVCFLLFRNKTKIYPEKYTIVANTGSFIVENSYIVNKSYDGKTLTDNYLIVVDAKVKKNYDSSEIYLNDFNIETSDKVYTPTTMYNKYLIDLGNGFYNDIATVEYGDYIFVYEIPASYINKKLLFTYNDGGSISYIKLNPNMISYDGEPKTIELGNELAFDDKLQGISFKINEYEIKNKYTINYSYCIKDNDCINSIEYIKATLDKNYDKYVIKLNIEYNNTSEYKYKFYNLLTTFGYIEYYIGDAVKKEKSIELLSSTKKSEKNVMYLGVNKEIADATFVNIVFNVRGKQYVYKVK